MRKIYLFYFFLLVLYLLYASFITRNVLDLGGVETTSNVQGVPLKPSGGGIASVLLLHTTDKTASETTRITLYKIRGEHAQLTSYKSDHIQAGRFANIRNNIGNIHDKSVEYIVIQSHTHTHTHKHIHTS